MPPEINEKLKQLTLRLLELKRDKKASNKDYNDQIKDVEGEIKALVEQEK